MIPAPSEVQTKGRDYKLNKGAGTCAVGGAGDHAVAKRVVLCWWVSVWMQLVLVSDGALP